MTKIILSLLFSIVVYAGEPVLFGEVINVSENDTLNVRSQSNYRSEKVGELPTFSLIGVEECTMGKKSIWCRVYQLVQQHYSNNFNPGWVNARYLKFRDQGYVNIRGEEKNCFYAVKCRNRANNKECLVVYALNYDYEKDEMIEMKSKWIKRKKLRGESAFGAASQNIESNPEGGYCTNARMIEDHLKKNPNFLKEK